LVEFYLRAKNGHCIRRNKSWSGGALPDFRKRLR
jgi:hypothetical protein